MDYICVVEGEWRSEIHFFKSLIDLQDLIICNLDNYIDLEDEFGLDTLDISFRVLYKPILD